MPEHTYKTVELTGSSRDGIDAAIRNAIAKASESLRLMEWFEVVQSRGHIADGALGHVQVKMKVGFRVE